MFDLILRTLKEQRAVLIVIVGGFIVLGVVIGIFRKEKIKVVEIDPKVIYRERTLSEISSRKEENGAKEIEDLLKQEKKEPEIPKDQSFLKSSSETSSKIEKTPIEDLLEIPKE